MWTWNERVEPKKPKVPNPRVLAVRVASLDDKEIMLRLDPVKFFTEPHYNGFPAVLVRLDRITAAGLKPLIAEAWRTQAPKELLEEEGAPAAMPGGRRPRRPPRQRRRPC